MAHHERGRANLRLPRNSDVIVDLCEQHYPNLSPGTPSLIYTAALDPYVTPCPQITTQNSWMGWSNRLRTQVQGGRIYHKPIGLGNVQVQQVKHDDDYEIVMFGHAQRILYKIPTPRLLSVKGRKVELIGDNHVDNEVIGVWCGWPIYWSKWVLRYKLDKAPPPDDFKTGTFRPVNPYSNTPGENTDIDQAKP